MTFMGEAVLAHDETSSFVFSSALTHVDQSKSVLLEFWSLHETRLNRCLALRHFEQRFKELQCHFIQLYNEILQLPDLNTSLLLFECYRTDHNSNTREEIDQTLIQVDDLSQRAQVIISFNVILTSGCTSLRVDIHLDDDQSCHPTGERWP